MITLDKPIYRKTRRDFMHYQRPLVVSLQPGDALAIRELRRRRVVFLDLHALYVQGVRQQVLAEKREKRLRRRMLRKAA
jgi:hypothetical protein